MALTETAQEPEDLSLTHLFIYFYSEDSLQSEGKWVLEALKFVLHQSIYNFKGGKGKPFLFYPDIGNWSSVWLFTSIFHGSEIKAEWEMA